MILKQLSLSYLSKHIGLATFNLTKESFKEISEDGHFKEAINDKDLATLIFKNSISDDFFAKKSNLNEFVSALPIITQNKILEELNVQELKWNKSTSDYFLQTLGLDKKFEYKSTTKTNFDQAVYRSEKPDKLFKKLKRYQSDVFFDTYDYISTTPYSRCIIQMPTGSGKTRTSMEIVCEIMNDTGKDVLWLANTEELVDQAYEAFIETWHFLRKREALAINHMRTAVSYSENDLIPAFHVSSLQSLNCDNLDSKLKMMNIDLTNLELLIVDEAHISIAPTYKKTIKNIIKKGAKLIGLTATPGRNLEHANNDSNENRLLSEFYYNKKFELNTGTEEPIEFLRKKGILSNAKFVSIEGSKLDNVLTKDEISHCLITNTIPKKIESILTNDVKRTAVIFDQLVSLLNENKKIIFFGSSIAHSKLICSLLNLKGYTAAHIDGNSGKYRKNIINSFKKGEVQLLCNYGVLSTGFDDPKIDVVFMARPTSSIVLYSQIIGRGLRGPLIGGTDVCEIHTVFDNFIDLPENKEIYSYFDDYFI